jgi:hypothetical protein
MRKSKAIELLGGSVASAAKTIGVSYQAIDKWPEDLPRRLADRVLAALARKHLPPELIGEGDAAATAAAGVSFAALPAVVRQRAIAGEG